MEEAKVGGVLGFGVENVNMGYGFGGKEVDTAVKEGKLRGGVQAWLKVLRWRRWTKRWRRQR